MTAKLSKPRGKDDDDCFGSISMKIRCNLRYFMTIGPLFVVLCLLLNMRVLHRELERRESEGMDPEKEENMVHVMLNPSSKAILDTPKEINSVTLPAPKLHREEYRAKRERNRRQMRRKSKVKVSSMDPNPLSLRPGATMSACLLIKDDNDLLPEWLAYHYHTARMRYLVVAVDPGSTELPMHILETWREGSELEIIEWSDKDYMPQDFLATDKVPKDFIQESFDFKIPMSEESMLEVSNHRYRQRVFFAECLQHMKDTNKDWLMHIDTDEYLVPSKQLREAADKHVNVPSLKEEGSMMTLLQDAVKSSPKMIHYPCIAMLRVLFGSKEDESTPRDEVPFLTNSFETLRWHFHVDEDNAAANGNPKVIMDVSVVPEDLFPDHVVFSIHRPITEICPRNKDLVFTRIRRQPISVNHYLGSWERYSRKADKRRTREQYDAKASHQRDKTDTVATEWLSGFVDSVGLPASRTLLGKSHWNVES